MLLPHFFNSWLSGTSFSCVLLVSYPIFILFAYLLGCERWNTTANQVCGIDRILAEFQGKEGGCQPARMDPKAYIAVNKPRWIRTPKRLDLSIKRGPNSAGSTETNLWSHRMRNGETETSGNVTILRHQVEPWTEPEGRQLHDKQYLYIKGGYPPEAKDPPEREPWSKKGRTAPMYIPWVPPQPQKLAMKAVG